MLIGFGDALRVYLAFALPGVLAAPLVRRAFPGLRDGGVSLSLGCLLITWLAWIFPSVSPIPYGTPLVLAATAAVGGLGAWIGWQDRESWKRLWRESGAPS